MFRNSIQVSDQQKVKSNEFLEQANLIKQLNHSAQELKAAISILRQEIQGTEAKIQVLNIAEINIKESIAQFIEKYELLWNIINEKKELAIKQADSKFQQAYYQGFSEGFFLHFANIGVEMDNDKMKLQLVQSVDDEYIQLLQCMDYVFNKIQKCIKDAAEAKADVGELSTYKELVTLINNHNQVNKQLDQVISEKVTANITLQKLLHEHKLKSEELNKILSAKASAQYKFNAQSKELIKNNRQPLSSVTPDQHTQEPPYKRPRI